MLDKDKLFLIIKIGSKRKYLSWCHQVIEYINRTFVSTLDDSVRTLIIVDDSTSELSVSKLNTENFTEDQLKEIADRFEVLVEAFLSRS